MTSPLVRQLVARIDQCQDPEMRACYIAELACYWARVGEFSDADRLRIDLRRDFGDGRSVRVSVLIMCIESLLMFFRELSPQARDRMARASLLSTAAGDLRLIAFTSAWMAHIDFNLNRFEGMTASIASCLAVIDADDGTADCRVSLVLGDAFLFVRAVAISNSWYARARAAATRIGDQAAIGALTYNRAALHLAAVRFQCASRSLPMSDIRLVLTEVQSAINYQAIAQLRSLDHLLQSVDIGVLILQERFVEVLQKIGDTLQSADVPLKSAQRALLQADRALALASTGKKADALQVIELFSDSDISSFGADDRVVIWSSVRRASQICGVTGEIDSYNSRISDAEQQHNVTVQRLSTLLEPFQKVSPIV